MTAERRKGGWIFLATLGVIGVGAYVYAFLFETPGQVSSLGIVALAAGNVCLLVIVSYVLVQWYHRRFSSSGRIGAVKKG
jgi:uncharacterized membrane protein YeaQ/YmgE (transglycosylase-associated protein family)